MRVPKTGVVAALLLIATSAAHALAPEQQVRFANKGFEGYRCSAAATVMTGLDQANEGFEETPESTRLHRLAVQASQDFADELKSGALNATTLETIREELPPRIYETTRDAIEKDWRVDVFLQAFQIASILSFNEVVMNDVEKAEDRPPVRVQMARNGKAYYEEKNCAGFL